MTSSKAHLLEDRANDAISVRKPSEKLPEASKKVPEASDQWSKDHLWENATDKAKMHATVLKLILEKDATSQSRPADESQAVQERRMSHHAATTSQSEGKF